MNRKNILIVDDEQDVLLVLEKGLTAEGYSVITASSGNDAISLAKSRHPDLIILDVLMPDMEGPEVKRKLKEDPETKDIPIIFLTGMFPKREDDQDGRIVAGYVLFEKPYDILKLVFAIEQLLREKVSSKL
jgi:CheY-like chemotaxis protein